MCGLWGEGIVAVRGCVLVVVGEEGGGGGSAHHTAPEETAGAPTRGKGAGGRAEQRHGHR